jgi:hypothetical protein
MKDAPINLPPHFFASWHPEDDNRRSIIEEYSEAYARAAVLADRAGREEPETPQQKVRRLSAETGLDHVECGACHEVYPWRARAAHGCAAPSPAEPLVKWGYLLPKGSTGHPDTPQSAEPPAAPSPITGEKE